MTSEVQKDNCRIVAHYKPTEGPHNFVVRYGGFPYDHRVVPENELSDGLKKSYWGAELPKPNDMNRDETALQKVLPNLKRRLGRIQIYWIAERLQPLPQPCTGQAVNFHVVGTKYLLTTWCSSLTELLGGACALKAKENQRSRRHRGSYYWLTSDDEIDAFVEEVQRMYPMPLNLHDMEPFLGLNPLTSFEDLPRDNKLEILAHLEHFLPLETRVALGNGPKRRIMKRMDDVKLTNLFKQEIKPNAENILAAMNVLRKIFGKLQLTCDELRMLNRTCHRLHGLSEARVLKKLTCLPNTADQSLYPGPPLSCESLTGILSNQSHAKLVKKLFLVGDDDAPNATPPPSLIKVLPNAENITSLLIKSFNTDSALPAILSFKHLCKLTAPSLRLLSNDELPSLKSMKLTNYTREHGMVGHCPNLKLLQITLSLSTEFLQQKPAVVDCASLPYLEDVSLDGEADALPSSFFSATPTSLRAFAFDGSKIEHKDMGGFWEKIAPNLHTLRLANITDPIRESFPELKVLEICACESGILDKLKFPALTHLRVSNIINDNLLDELSGSVGTTVKVLLIEETNPDYDGLLELRGGKFIEELSKAKCLKRLRFTGFRPVCFEKLESKGLEVFEWDYDRKSLDTVDPERLFSRPGLSYWSHWFSDDYDSDDEQIIRESDSY